jgi:hypothetical protein
MKQIRLLYVILALLPAWNGLQAQQKTDRENEQVQLDSLTQFYRQAGIPEAQAAKRAQTVVRRQAAVRTRSGVYNTTPVAGSIWLDRDSITGAPSASHTHNFTPEQFVKDVFVKGGREIADEAIRNVTLISNTWSGSPSTTWNNKGYTGPFGGDAGSWTSPDRELLYFDHGDISSTIPGWDGNPVPLFGIEKGFLLSTGPGLVAEGTNSSDGALWGGFATWADLHGGSVPASSERDPNLSPISSGNIETFTSLEFDFRPFVDSISFQYIFASEEFPDYANSSVNDIFGFFVSEVNGAEVLTDEWGNSGDTINIARFPNGQPVTINNSNWGYSWSYNSLSTPQWDQVSPEYHVPVYAGADLMEYDGHSIVLTARARVTPGKWYHLKLAISNVVDGAYGSGVFLAAGSLDLGAPKSEIPRSYIKTDYDSIYGYSSLYASCVNQLSITFNPGTTGSVKVWSRGSGANYAYDADGEVFFKDTVEYPITALDSALSIRFKVADNVPDGSSLYFFSQLSGSSKLDTSEVFTLYRKSTFAAEPFISPTVQYAGRLVITVTGGSPYIQRSLDGGQSWEFARDPVTGADVPFTTLQIQQIANRDSMYILYREPNTCCSFDSILVAYPSISKPAILRQVVIPHIPGASTEPAAGLHYVRSSDDFVFRVIPEPECRDWELCIRALRQFGESEEDDGVTVVSDPDGGYTVQIKRIQENIRFVVTFLSPLTGTVPVEPAAVWSSGGRLHIRASEAGEVQVRSISGTLVRTLAPAAGETVGLSLPPGFYLVTKGGKTCKIIIQ